MITQIDEFMEVLRDGLQGMPAGYRDRCILYYEERIARLERLDNSEREILDFLLGRESVPELIVRLRREYDEQTDRQWLFAERQGPAVHFTGAKRSAQRGEIGWDVRILEISTDGIPAEIYLYSGYETGMPALEPGEYICQAESGYFGGRPLFREYQDGERMVLAAEMQGGSFRGTFRMYICVPAEVREIYCHGTDGKITVFGLETEKLYIRTRSQDILLEGISAEDAEITAGSADAEVRRSLITALGISTETGDITVTESEGNLLLDTKDGDTEVFRHRGGIRILTETGDIDISAAGDVLRVQSFAGDADITVSEPGYEMDVRTLEGDIDITCTGDPTVYLRSESGDIRTEEEITDSVYMRQGTDGEIRVRTEEGDIRLNS